jgi:hypothetical protein
MPRPIATVVCALLSACGPVPSQGAFDLLPVTKTPCEVAPVGPVTLRQGAATTVQLSPSRSDVRLALFLVPDDLEAQLDGLTLRLAAGYRFSGASSLSLTMTCEGRESLVEVPVSVTPRLRWGTPITWTTGPSAREHPALVIDPASPDVLWLYGGLGFVPQQFTVMNDLWRLDLRTGAWTEVVAQQAPLVAGGRLALTKEAGVFLLFGGQDANDDISRVLYRLDTRQSPARFEVVQAAAAPGSTLNAFVFDAPRDRWVAFGGFDGAEPSGVTHSLSLSGAPAWSPVMPRLAPSPRYGFFWALDGARLVVASGAQQPRFANPINPAKDTWALDLATLEWTQVDAGDDEAPAQRNGCGGFDPVSRRWVVWGGTADGRGAVDGLAVLSLGDERPRWRKAVPAGQAPVRASCAGVFDAARRRVLLGFGNTAAARYADLQVLELVVAPDARRARSPREPLPGRRLDALADPREQLEALLLVVQPAPVGGEREVHAHALAGDPDLLHRALGVHHHLLARLRRGDGDHVSRGVALDDVGVGRVDGLHQPLEELGHRGGVDGVVAHGDLRARARGPARWAAPAPRRGRGCPRRPCRAARCR